MEELNSTSQERENLKQTTERFEKNMKRLEDVFEKYGPMFNDLWNEAKTLGKEMFMKNIVVVKEEVLSRDAIMKLARKNIVKGSNKVSMMREKYEDKDEKGWIVHLAYMKGDELIDTDDNMFVNIKCESLSRDAEELFGGEDMVILG